MTTHRIARDPQPVSPLEGEPRHALEKVDFGGVGRFRAPFHGVLHAEHEVDAEMLLARVAEIQASGGERLWLCGGEPADHPAFLAVMREARLRGMGVGMQTMAHPFAAAGFAQRVRSLGLDHARILVLGGDAERHEALLGEGSWMAFALGVEALREAGITRSAHLVVGPGDAQAMATCEHRLRGAGIVIDRITRLDAVEA